jgi:co-chaperonin GroES (HSP10)
MPGPTIKIDANADLVKLGKKYEADKSTSIDWQPAFGRIKIQPDRETISNLLVIPESQKDVLVRGTILGIGEGVGLMENGSVFHNLQVGQRVLYVRGHETKYVGTDDVEHYFLATDSTSSIFAVEPMPSANVGEPFYATPEAAAYAHAAGLASQASKHVHKKSKGSK